MLVDRFFFVFSLPVQSLLIQFAGWKLRSLILSFCLRKSLYLRLGIRFTYLIKPIQLEETFSINCLVVTTQEVTVTLRLLPSLLRLLGVLLSLHLLFLCCKQKSQFQKVFRCCRIGKQMSHGVVFFFCIGLAKQNYSITIITDTRCEISNFCIFKIRTQIIFHNFFIMFFIINLIRFV